MHRIYAMIGFAAKSGKCSYGAYSVEAAIKKRKARLILMDRGLSCQSKTKYINLCDKFNVQVLEIDKPCSAAGKPDKLVMAVNDNNFAELILNEFNRSGGKK